ncbi:hypothetical protein FISHEDRAFT_70342 [Fistulina hepatica ATCC 64428]|uniref:Uncharacterized protein n=1 Tax=Fistulina hepatica ATCC 64428 TaxID=1128425 RepID=A0A0D7AM41_9AGAR|nr:hypothetical protein FISHEDRAFT_70342 [Fistulina hepatica ATCC 64428]
MPKASRSSASHLAKADLSMVPASCSGPYAECSRTPAERVREARLLADEMADVLSPFLVRCKRCQGEIKLSAKSTFDIFHWKIHRERCLKRNPLDHPNKKGLKAKPHVRVTGDKPAAAIPDEYVPASKSTKVPSHSKAQKKKVQSPTSPLNLPRRASTAPSSTPPLTPDEDTDARTEDGEHEDIVDVAPLYEHLTRSGSPSAVCHDTYQSAPFDAYCSSSYSDAYYEPHSVSHDSRVASLSPFSPAFPSTGTTSSDSNSVSPSRSPAISTVLKDYLMRSHGAYGARDYNARGYGYDSPGYDMHEPLYGSRASDVRSSGSHDSAEGPVSTVADDRWQNWSWSRLRARFPTVSSRLECPRGECERKEYLLERECSNAMRGSH